MVRPSGDFMKSLLIMIFFFGSVIGSADEKKTTSEVVAEVNGTKITVDELESYFEQTLLFPSHKKTTLEDALDFLISRELSIQKAKELNIHKDPIIIRQQQDILHQALISQELEEAIAKIEMPTEKELKNYYKAHPEYKTSHILFRIRAIPTKEEVKLGYETMLNIYQMAKEKPESFEELAKQHSQAINSEQGGDLGFLPSTSLSPEYYQAIKGQKIGFISEPVRTHFGFHVIKVTGVKDFKDIDQDLYKKIIFDIKRDQLVLDFYAKLKKSAKIKIHKDKLK